MSVRAIFAFACILGLLGCGDGDPPAPDRVVARDAGSGNRCLGHGQPAAATCVCDSDCVTGRCAGEESTGLAGRLCAAPCIPGVLECDTTQVCIGAQGSTEPGLCFDGCTSSDDCAPGLLCFTNPDACQPWCTRDSDCAAGGCDLHSGRCDDPLPGELGVGQPCLEHRDCRSGLCNVVCSTFCDTRAPSCPDDAVCIGREPRGIGLCYIPCRVTADCPGGLLCATAAGELVCLEPAP